MTVYNRNLSHYAQEAYRDYALYVLLDRALARYSDGLKPVQRRILYAMHELHLTPQAKPKKAVRAIGDTLGKYHPHSDQAGYEALIGLAQGFAIRYPLIYGQGNFGSVDDPKSFASMRYTEVRLSSYSPILFKELSNDSVKWQPNFDGTLQEPIELPAQLPILLLNGCSGIAVGLSTEIPPHHLGECVDALLHYIKHPGASLETLLKHMPGPDFPGGGILRASKEDLLKFYAQGKGSFNIDAVIDQKGSSLIITQIPYTSMTSKILEQLNNINQVRPVVAPFTLIDESDEANPVRVVINFKTPAQAKSALPFILDKTDCSVAYRCYFNAIDKAGLPRCFTLREFFEQWVEYRLASLLAQFQARQITVAYRRQILNVYKVGFYSLDRIFNALQHSNDPWGELKHELGLSSEDVEILSALRLKDLSKLSIEKIEVEEKSLIDENAILSERIMFREKRLDVIIDQLKSLKQQYGDRRRTQILEPRAKVSLNDSAIAVVKEEPKLVWIMLTEFGWAKLIRPPKNSNEMNFSAHCRPGDKPIHTLHIMDDKPVFFVDNKGRSYSISAGTLSSSKFGEHLSSVISLPSGNHIIFISELAGMVALVTSQGYGFTVDLSDITLNKRGKQIVRVIDNEVVSWAGLVELNSGILISSSQKTYGLLDLNSLPVRQSGRGVILWKGSADIESIEPFIFQKNALETISATGKHSSYDGGNILIKRGQSLRSSGKKVAIRIKK